MKGNGVRKKEAASSGAAKGREKQVQLAARKAATGKKKSFALNGNDSDCLLVQIEWTSETGPFYT